MNYKIYELICPLSKEVYPYNIKYVGKTSLKGCARLAYHAVDSCRNRKDKPQNEDKNTWIKSLIEDHSVFPIYKIIKSSLTGIDATIEESSRVKELIGLGVNLYNITYNDDKSNPKVADSRKKKGSSCSRDIYIFNLDFNLVRKVSNIQELCEEFNIGKKMFHLVMKNRLVLKEAYIISYKPLITSEDVNLTSYKTNKISCWSLKTRTRVSYFNGSAQAAKELGFNYNVIKSYILNKRVIQNKYVLTFGDDRPIFPKRYNVYKDDKLIETFYSIQETANYCNVFKHNINNYISQKSNKCNGFHIEKNF